MLKELTIQNFAIIKTCHLEFSEGFTVFTGETGAGKSIIIDALSLLLGKPSQESFIQDGEEEAYIEGIFEIATTRIPEALAEFISPEDTHLILSRKLQRGKLNIAKINGQSLPLKQFKQAASGLLTIVGQHDYMTLLEPEQQIAYLDHYGGKELALALSDYQERYRVYETIRAKLKATQMAEDEKDSRREFLSFQVEDLKAQQFKSGEEEKLDSQKRTLKSLHILTSHLSESEKALYTIQTQTAIAQKAIIGLEKIDPSYAPLTVRLEALVLEVQDLYQEIDSRASDMSDLDISNLDNVEKRLDTIFRYKTKYKAITIDEILSRLATLNAELQAIDNQDENRAALELELKKEKESLKKIAATLTQLRQDAAQKLSQEIIKEMAFLKFESCQFDIQIQTDFEQPNLLGCDTIAFYVSTNAGSKPKLLSDVASGGELSRMMLAIRSVFAEQLLQSTAIFDEIDAGVGGLTAIKIGEKLQALSQKSQLFCVTHLAQIAKFADHHIVISKSTQAGQTRTSTQVLTKSERINELKRMVGGDEITSLLVT